MLSAAATRLIFKITVMSLSLIAPSNIKTSKHSYNIKKIINISPQILKKKILPTGDFLDF